MFGYLKAPLKTKQILISLCFFLSFSGYYAILILHRNIATNASSRNLTIPLRLIISILLLLLFLLKPRFKLHKGVFPFLLFSLAYIIRISIEYFNYKTSFHIPEEEFFLYFLSFVLFPILLISQFELSSRDFNIIFISLITGAIFTSALTVYFYGDLIGKVSRISLSIDPDENYISPLALSYTSALSIGVSIAYMLTNKVSHNSKLILFFNILICLIPFYLGCSRGSVIALGLPFIAYIFFVKGINKRLTSILSFSILCIIFYLSSDYFGDRVFLRIFNIFQDIEYHSSSAIRIEIWRSSIEQFLNNPLFGNSLESTFRKHYPHNIIIEVLITTGIIGFIPFAFFLYYVFKKCILIMRFQAKYLWISFIFLQSFIQGMFSGALYSASWFAISSALIIALKTENNNTTEVN